MTLMYELDLDILKMYPNTKTGVSRSRLSEVKARTWQTDRHRQTRGQTRPNAFPRRIRVW